MKVIHPTHLLFCEPTSPPSEKPVEDYLTRQVDEIFAALVPTTRYRGFHTTPYGVNSDAYDYEHPTLPIIANSLSPYYIRYHRQDITSEEIANIHQQYIAIKVSDYWNVPLTDFYVITYEKGSGYGDVSTAVAHITCPQGKGREIVEDSLFMILPEWAYLEMVERSVEEFEFDFYDKTIKSYHL